MNGMSFPRLALLLLVMAGVTYLMRVLPFTLLRRPVRSPFLRSLLAYIPYGVLSAMAFPSILYSTGSFPSAVAGTAAALVLAFALALNGWQSAKPALLDRAVQWTRQQMQTLRYGSNAAAGLPEGDLRNVGPRRTTQETVLNITMQTPASYYLRGFTGEIYENNRWTALDAETLYPASDSFYWLHQDSFYAQAQIAAAADSVLPELLETKNSLTVENVGLSSRYLYAPYELLPDSAGLDASAVGDCTLAAQGFYGQRSYTLSAGTGLITQYQKINASLAQLPEDTQFLRDEAAYNAFAYQNYTAIPSDIRSYLAEKLGDYSVEEGETHFDYQNAKQNILFYLTSYIDYEETNLAPVGDGIFLDGTQKGYDIHYATAAALMFRYYGIPARYVEGFLVTKQDAQVLSAGQTLSLTGAAAHAWVEYYQDGVGWLPFEVTPSYLNVMGQAEQFQDISGVDGSSAPDEQQNEDQAEESPEEQEEDNSIDWLRVLTVLLLIGIILLMSSFIAIGIFVSTLTENQIVSAIISYVLIFALWYSYGLGSAIQNPMLLQLLNKLSLMQMYYELALGILNPAGIALNLAITASFLLLTTAVVRGKRG